MQQLPCAARTQINNCSYDLEREIKRVYSHWKATGPRTAEWWYYESRPRCVLTSHMQVRAHQFFLPIGPGFIEVIPTTKDGTRTQQTCSTVWVCPYTERPNYGNYESRLSKALHDYADCYRSKYAMLNQIYSYEKLMGYILAYY